MKKLLFIALITIAFSCKNEPKKEITREEVKEETIEKYPSEFEKIFQTHGGISAWKKARTLSYNLGEEVHTVDLKTRKTAVNSTKYSLGFDGKEVWLTENEKGAYKGNPTFYYNLYFYFYAMPFVFADDGIIYEKVAPISFEGTNYPGYKISYKANIGTTPDDNYILYYNPKSYQMEWLAYTVTFNSKAPSEKYNLIKYHKWENVSGLILPKEITWYEKDEKGNPTKPANHKTVFTVPFLSDAKLSDSFFEKPAK
jgi:hypothetical protein